MPIIKKLSGHARPQKIMKYILNPAKTRPELAGANGCRIDEAAREFEYIRACNGMDNRCDARTYHHVIMSFNTEAERITPEEVRDMTKEWLDQTKLRDYQYVYAVHIDKESHYHAHVVVNNVSIFTDKEMGVVEGRALQVDKKDLKNWMERANEIAKKHGYEKSIVDLNEKAAVRMDGGEAQMLLKRDQVPWKEELRSQIAMAASEARSEEEFKEIMKYEYGVSITEDKKGKFKYLPDSFDERDGRGIKACSERRLGEAYSRENINELIKEREETRTHE